MFDIFSALQKFDLEYSIPAIVLTLTYSVL